MPKRFNVKTCMLQEDDGKYVTFSDYVTMHTRLLKAEAAYDALEAKSRFIPFVICENFPADAGHKISVVIAQSSDEALQKYKEATHRVALPSWLTAEPVTEQVTEVYRYDNPNYEG